MDPHLRGKVFLVTGASAGIGVATVRLLARQITGAEWAVGGGALQQL
ncbi:hypothetical protein [Kitasatospora sp. NPDC087314]